MEQREIKFRAWQNGMILQKESGVYRMKKFLDQCYEDCILMQFTGLHDKNGKEVFEGDIIRYEFKSTKYPAPHPYIGKIFFDEFMFLIDGDDVYNEWHSLNRISNVEVIGNIYEHPDLLKNTILS